MPDKQKKSYPFTESLKSQIPSIKFQTNLKFEILMTQTTCSFFKIIYCFVIWDFGHWYLFVIWNFHQPNYSVNGYKKSSFHPVARNQSRPRRDIAGYFAPKRAYKNPGPDLALHGLRQRIPVQEYYRGHRVLLGSRARAGLT